MHLFEPFPLRGITLRNRVVVSPMCQYSADDGAPNDWHLVHLGSRAVGGAGLVMTEASAITQEGRISPDDAGIYRDNHVESWRRITAFVHKHGARIGIQLAHAGRKASTSTPWKGEGSLEPFENGWRPLIAPSALAFDDKHPVPESLDAEGIASIVEAFRRAAQRSLDAGFEAIEIHAAHGYLLHQFLSPLSNQRRDCYGGNFENRTRLCREVVEAVRKVWPERLPLLIRISATDWVDGGWSIAESVELARHLKSLGVDLIDCSSGGLVPYAQIPTKPGYQIPFAARIRREAAIATGAVGLISEPTEAQHIVEHGDADLVFLARELLRDPYWPMHAAKVLGRSVQPPPQYARAWLV